MSSKRSTGSSRSRRQSRKKLEKKKIAAQQIERLINLAIVQSKVDSSLAQRQASIAWQMATRFNVKLREKRMLFCRYCKQFILPPDTARYRLSKKRNSINITCLKCGKTYRKLLSKPV